MAGRISQQVLEADVVGSPNARASQLVAEVEASGSPNARASQLVAEVSGAGSPVARMSQIAVEVLLYNLEVDVLPIYPDQSVLPGLGYNVKWAPEAFAAATQKTATGAEIDLSYSDTPLHTFTLVYDFLRDSTLMNRGSSEFKRMMGFFLRINGTPGRFLLRHPDDNSVVAQAVATTDGLASVWTLSRTFGVGEDVGTEPVGYVDLTRDFNVYVDSVKQDISAYEVLQTTPGEQQLKFYSTPAAGHAITVDMSYFYYCKFPDNSVTFEKFMDRLWTLGQIQVRTCRANA